MITELKPYPAMKPSGVEWLEDVPDHWYVHRAKWLFRNLDRPVRETDEVVTCFRDGTVTLRKNRRLAGFTEALKEIGYQGVRCGDLVIHMMDAFAGSIGVSDSDGKCTPVYAICEAGSLANPQYYARVVREMARRQWILALSKGVRERSTDFRFAAFAVQLLPVPPPAEQAAIVRYLDHVDRRISRYIRAKQRLIELLEEEKQVVIHRAVTRGLDPDVRLKPSGVEWLGDVPEHWEVRRIRNVAQMRVSNVDKHVKSEEIPVRLCNYVDVYKNDLIDGRLDFMRATATADEIARFLLKAGDVLITKDSETWDDIAVPALVTEPIPNLISGYHLALLRPRTGDLTGEFLLRALQSKGVAHQFHVGAGGVTRYGLSHAAIQSVWIPLPPLSEQAAIVSHLDHETTHMDAARDRAQREIELLREYRTRLMADVVTGKLDVRAAAADLPEGDETDVFDILDIDDVAEHELAPELEEVAT